MKRYIALLLSLLLLMLAVPPVSANGIYNDDEMNWGEYACTHSDTRTVEAVESTCTTAGHAAYTRCTECGVVTEGSDAELPLADHVYFNDCESVCLNCGEVTNPDAAHNIIHVEAKEATCTEMGNIEHWYCDVCGAAWLDADCTKNTNLRAVILPMTEEHTYDNDSDADCNLCGYVRSVAIAGDADGNGKVNNRDLALLQQHINGWDVEVDVDAADVDDNGKVNNRDLALLQQYINGWDVELK